MGILDTVTRRVKDNLAYKASDGATSALSKGATSVFGKKNKLDKCPKCKTKIKDGSLKFCPNCGNRLVVTCPKCSVDYPMGTKFCIQCGDKLK